MPEVGVPRPPREKEGRNVAPRARQCGPAGADRTISVGNCGIPGTGGAGLAYGPLDQTTTELGGSMHIRKLAITLATIAMAATMGGAVVPAAQAHSTGIHDNCTNLNKKWPH